VVKTTKFIHGPQGERLLVTGGDDQTLKLWAVHEDLSSECLQTVHEHSAPINCLAALKSWGRGCSTTLVASGAADATIRIWTLEACGLRLVQTIKTSPKYFPLDLALACPRDESNLFILAAAGTRDAVQIFTAAGSENCDPEFAHQATLSGHDGWIRSLDFTLETDNAGADLLLASASQDKYVRIWRVHRGKQLPAMSAGSSADPSGPAYLPGKSPSNKAHRLSIGDEDFSITFEALLLGHEDWIYSARWTSLSAGKLCLLSTSADNSLCMWEPDPSSGIWVSTVRLGEISREKGATTATGSIGGFWTGLWRGDGKSVLCLGRTGSWRRWDLDPADDQWKPAIAVTGHTKAVTGISWSKNGDYLLSTSSDQTTRLHAPWIQDGTTTWHEMSRPQIHGYDLNCIDSLGHSQFVSGADEKLMRVFNEPRPIATLLQSLSGGDASASHVEQLPDTASIPVLGLSNKAVDQDVTETEPPQHPPNLNASDRQQLDEDSLKSASLAFDHAPFEETLSRHTLWPEIEKLYGHGYEISCLATSHDGHLVASACKATSANHAVLRLFETGRWTEIKPPLTAHSLTAARLRFSPDDRYILSVGRDRQWAVFGRRREQVAAEEGGGGGGGEAGYEMVQSDPKGHSRMILDCAWAPCDGASNRVFATAGRDKQVKIWVGEENHHHRPPHNPTFTLATTIPSDVPATAVDFLPVRTKTGRVVLAVGDEAGKISIHVLDPGDFTAKESLKLEER
jgi:elongator complex protein 2